MLTRKQIRDAVIPLAQKYNLTRVELFGSYATNTAAEESDADFLVEFAVKPPSIFKVM